MSNQLLEEYMSYAKEQTDAPDLFLEMAFIGVIGTLIGQKRYINFGSNGIAPNFWMVLLAPSGCRKSTANRIAIKLVKKVAPELFIPNEFSHEKLLDLLEAQPNSMLVFDEFLSLTTLLNRDFMQNTKSVLTELWDEYEEYRRKTMNKDVVIIAPCVAIQSATTATWFKQRLQENDLLGGFLPRFLFVVGKRQHTIKPYPPPPDEEKERSLIEKLITIKSIHQQPLLPIEKAMKLYQMWYMDFYNKLGDNTYDVFFNRFNIYLLKIAIVLETMKSLGNSIQISEETMKEAINIIDKLHISIKQFIESEMSFTREEMLQKKLLSYFREQKTPQSISQLHKRFSWSVKTMQDTLNALIASGRIIQKYVQNQKDEKGRGRPVKMFMLSGEEEVINNV
jgi:hypothetical protein